MEVVSEEEEQRRPAGKARDDPNMNPFLDPPKWVGDPSQNMYMCIMV